MIHQPIATYTHAYIRSPSSTLCWFVYARVFVYLGRQRRRRQSGIDQTNPATYTHTHTLKWRALYLYQKRARAREGLKLFRDGRCFSTIGRGLTVVFCCGDRSDSQSAVVVVRKASNFHATRGNGGISLTATNLNNNNNHTRISLRLHIATECMLYAISGIYIDIHDHHI